MSDPTQLEQAFLDDIVAHPDDPSLWLILGDYLDEREDPRAELLRLTWQLQYEPTHRVFTKRQARVQELLAGGMVPVRPRMTVGGIEFAWIPPGTFLMGSPANERDRRDGEEQHRVTLTKPFWMGVYPVTQAQWRDVLGENHSAYSRRGTGSDRVRDLPDEALDRCPAEQVSWQRARVFCERLSERVGRPIVLPTEAQWEFACRAGTRTPFYFGATLNGDNANCDGNFPYGTTEKGPYLRHPSPVGTYVGNAWGLYDLHGNVYEWAYDAYRTDYEALPEVDPVCDDANVGVRVLRGGSWDLYAQWCRSAFRSRYDTTSENGSIGFRVCHSA